MEQSIEDLSCVRVHAHGASPFVRPLQSRCYSAERVVCARSHLSSLSGTGSAAVPWGQDETWVGCLGELSIEIERERAKRKQMELEEEEASNNLDLVRRTLLTEV